MENTQTKTCPRCGRTLTADNFYRKGDGSLYTYCKECVKANNRKYRNTPPRFGKSLSAYTPRQLMQELKRRGYTGKLKLVTINEIDLNNL